MLSLSYLRQFPRVVILGQLVALWVFDFSCLQLLGQIKFQGTPFVAQFKLLLYREQLSELCLRVADPWSHWGEWNYVISNNLLASDPIYIWSYGFLILDVLCLFIFGVPWVPAIVRARAQSALRRLYPAFAKFALPCKMWSSTFYAAFWVFTPKLCVPISLALQWHCVGCFFFSL